MIILDKREKKLISTSICPTYRKYPIKYLRRQANHTRLSPETRNGEPSQPALAE